MIDELKILPEKLHNPPSSLLHESSKILVVYSKDLNLN